MPNPHKIRRKLNKKVIKNLGLDTVFLRHLRSSGVDAYGEPVTSPTPYVSTPIRIVIDTDKRKVESSEIGGLADDKRDFIYFYCDGATDLRIGDAIVFPANSDNHWLVGEVIPTMINDIPVIMEAKAFRDNRF